MGLVAMQLAQTLSKPLVRQREPKPTDVFLTERTISPLGPQHHPDESATDALGRIAYQKLVGRQPSPRMKNRLSWGVHIGYGLFVASLYGLTRGGRTRRPLRDGLLFGAGLWLFGEELAVPLLGLGDKPTAYHPTLHLQTLLAHLGFGLATAGATQLVEARS